MIQLYTIYLNKNRHIVYGIGYNLNTKFLRENEAVKKIKLDSSSSKFFNKLIMYRSLFPKLKFRTYLQDGWVIRNIPEWGLENRKKTPFKLNCNIFETYINEYNEVVIIEITEKEYLDYDYNRIFYSPFSINSVFTKFLGYTYNIPKFRFIEK